MMYGLPEDLDLSFFIGRRLDQVCLGEFQVQLNFDDATAVHMNDSEYSFRGTRRRSREGRDLHDRLGKTFTSATREGEGDLRLEI